MNSNKSRPSPSDSPEAAESHEEAAARSGPDVVGKARQVVGHHLTGPGPVTLQPHSGGTGQVRSLD